VIWTTWRQHRPEALVGLAALVAVAALFFVADQRRYFTHGVNNELAPFLQASLFVLPALVGVFVGAPLLARDLERGTHRLLWTQGVTRSRWLAGKLALVVGAVAVAAALVGAYVALVLHGQHLTVAGGKTVDAFDPWGWYDELGPAFAAYVVFALSLGIALGAVVGRTYPAMALTLVGYIAVRAPIGMLARPRYLPPLREQLTSVTNIPSPGPHAWLLQQVYQDAASGRPLSIMDALLRSGPPGDRLAQHGLVGWQYYQPGDRFWLFQGVEAAIFVALAALLVGLTYSWTTRRVA
jgi:ABC-2 family transporter protein